MSELRCECCEERDVAYPGALRCGAGCTARHEAGDCLHFNSKKPEPGFYWVRWPRDSNPNWTIGQVASDGNLYVVGCDYACFFRGAEFGPEIERPS